MSDTEKIRQQAIALGFSLVGFARAEPLQEEGERLREWLRRGYHGTMEWMNRDPVKRTDVNQLVPGARTVISLALNYYTEHEHQALPGIGKVSRYAWGDDYHRIMTSKLRTLWEWTEKAFPGIKGRYYVDTGPVMDKVWAQRAGLGWIGKHTNLITKEIGSWVFLGEIITTMELAYDSSETDHCGTCTLCIEACPTDAIVEAYIVDSNKCISYLTIEQREEIKGFNPDTFDGWIYGCDICQDVCPWNEKFSQPTNEQNFEPREWNRSPGLEEWGRMTEGEFREKFRGSAMKRTKYDGLMRNVRFADQASSGSRERS